MALYQKNLAFGFKIAVPNRKLRQTPKTSLPVFESLLLTCVEDTREQCHFRLTNCLASTGTEKVSLPVLNSLFSIGSDVTPEKRHLQFRSLGFQPKLTSHGKHVTFAFEISQSPTGSSVELWKRTTSGFETSFFATGSDVFPSDIVTSGEKAVSSKPRKLDGFRWSSRNRNFRHSNSTVDSEGAKRQQPADRVCARAHTAAPRCNPALR